MADNTINNDMTMDGPNGTLLAGRYRVVRQLGQGGMGSVWLAEDTKLDGFKVAIKMLPSVLVNNKRAYVQVKAEALVSLKLSHPNIVTVRAFEEDGGSPFLVMDYIDGQTLDDYLAEKGKLTEEETVRLLKPVAAALDYAHSQGVVHRDVKPGNVMISKDGTPFVLDFGIAREIQETMTRVTGKLSSGTLLYMSPEQLHGAAPKPAQDIYSFAAMAYECLTGHPPFSRGGIEDQIKHKTPEPLDPRFANCGSGVMAGLAKSSEERPATCVAVLLMGASCGKMCDAGDGTSSGKTRIVAVLLVVLALVALAGGGLWGWKTRNDAAVAQRAEVARQQKEGRRLAEERRIAEEKRIADDKRIVEEKRMFEERHVADKAELAEDLRVAEVKKTVEEQRKEKEAVAIANAEEQSRLAAAAEMKRQNELACEVQGKNEDKQFARQLYLVRNANSHYVEDAVGNFVKEGKLPGAISVLFKDGVQEQDCMGWADVENKVPMSMDSTFMICSQTKGFCGVCVAMLAEEGRLSIDDPVSKYLPNFASLRVMGKADALAPTAMTIRHLFANCAGFPFDVESRNTGGWVSVPLSEVVEEASKMILLYEPGSRFQYSNVGIDVAAVIVEKVSGLPYAKFLKKRVLEPLGMNNTTFNPTDEQLSRMVKMYKLSDGGMPQPCVMSYMPEPHNGPNVYVSASSGLWSTADDLIKFYKMLMFRGLCEDGTRLLKEETVVSLFATSQIPQGLKGNYSLGFAIADGFFGHGGAWGTNCMVNWQRKELKLWVVQLTGGPRPWDALRDDATVKFFSSGSLINNAEKTPIRALPGKWACSTTLSGGNWTSVMKYEYVFNGDGSYTSTLIGDAVIGKGGKTTVIERGNWLLAKDRLTLRPDAFSVNNGPSNSYKSARAYNYNLLWNEEGAFELRQAEIEHSFKNGQVTTYQYDVQGREIRRTKSRDGGTSTNIETAKVFRRVPIGAEDVVRAGE